MKRLAIFLALFIPVLIYGQSNQVDAKKAIVRQWIIYQGDTLNTVRTSGDTIFFERGGTLDTMIVKTDSLHVSSGNYSVLSGSKSVAFDDVFSGNDTLALGSAVGRANDMIYVARTDAGGDSVVITGSPTFYYNSTGYVTFYLDGAATGALIQSDGVAWYVLGVFSEQNHWTKIGGDIENNNAGNVTINGTLFMPDSTTNARLGFGLGWERTTGKVFVYRLSELRDTLNRDAALSPSVYDTWIRDTTGHDLYPAFATDSVVIGDTNAQAQLHVNGGIYFKGGAADYNGDGDVSVGDVISMQENIGNPDSINTIEKYSRLDLDADGLITLTDVFLAKYCFGNLYPFLDEDEDKFDARVRAGKITGGVFDDSTYIYPYWVEFTDGIVIDTGGAAYEKAGVIRRDGDVLLFFDGTLWDTLNTTSAAQSKWAKVGNYISPVNDEDSVLIGLSVLSAGAPARTLEVNGTSIYRGMAEYDNGIQLNASNLDIGATTSSTGAILSGGTQFLNFWDGQVRIGNGPNRTSTGDNNIIIGNTSAGYLLTSGIGSVIIGDSAGARLNSVNYNTLIGYKAGANINRLVSTHGYYNTAIGYEAMKGAIGGTGMRGSQSVAVGAGSLRNCTTTTGSVAIGYETGISVTSGNYNTLLGYKAGYSLTTGASNVMIGANSGYNETGSNTLYIDNSNTTTPLIKGDFNADTLLINGDLAVTPGKTLYAGIIDSKNDQITIQSGTTSFQGDIVYTDSFWNRITIPAVYSINALVGGVSWEADSLAMQWDIEDSTNQKILYQIMMPDDYEEETGIYLTIEYTNSTDDDTVVFFKAQYRWTNMCDTLTAWQEVKSTHTECAPQKGVGSLNRAIFPEISGSGMEVGSLIEIKLFCMTNSTYHAYQKSLTVHYEMDKPGNDERQ